MAKHQAANRAKREKTALDRTRTILCFHMAETTVQLPGFCDSLARYSKRPPRNRATSRLDIVWIGADAVMQRLEFKQLVRCIRWALPKSPEQPKSLPS